MCIEFFFQKSRTDDSFETETRTAGCWEAKVSYQGYRGHPSPDFLHTAGLIMANHVCLKQEWALIHVYIIFRLNFWFSDFAYR